MGHKLTKFEFVLAGKSSKKWLISKVEKTAEILNHLQSMIYGDNLLNVGRHIQ